MIAAPSVEAVAAGAYQLVLGEIHPAFNALPCGAFMPQHPSPEKILEALDQDLPEPRVIPVLPRNWPALTARTVRVPRSKKDYYLSFVDDCDGPPLESRSLPIAACVVREVDGEVRVELRDRSRWFDVVEVAGEALSSLVVDNFRLLPVQRHTPRVLIDGFVFSRETWRFAPQEMAFAGESEEMARYLGMRRWARKHGLPRLVFVKSPGERKPVFIDLESPLFCNLLSKLVRSWQRSGNEAPFSVVEMVPGPDQTWLVDGRGARYTSELRIVAVDLSPRLAD